MSAQVHREMGVLLRRTLAMLEPGERERLLLLWRTDRGAWESCEAELRKQAEYVLTEPPTSEP